MPLFSRVDGGQDQTAVSRQPAAAVGEQFQIAHLPQTALRDGGRFPTAPKQRCDFVRWPGDSSAIRVEKIGKQYNIAPLTDEDVAEMKRRLANADIEELENFYNQFSREVYTILDTIIKQTNKNQEDDLVEIERLKRILSFVPNSE